MAVDYEIYPQNLSEFIKATLLTLLSKFAEGFPWNFLTTVVREFTSWQDVMKMNPSIPYFNGRFLKVKPGAKSDGSQIFSTPTKPIEFSLVVDREQWLAAKEYLEDQQSNFKPGVSQRLNPTVCSFLTLKFSSESMKDATGIFIKAQNATQSREGLPSEAFHPKEKAHGKIWLIIPQDIEIRVRPGTIHGILLVNMYSFSADN